MPNSGEDGVLEFESIWSYVSQENDFALLALEKVADQDERGSPLAVIFRQSCCLTSSFWDVDQLSASTISVSARRRRTTARQDESTLH
ncbi:unnamed protein product [Caretta caretta]